MAQRLGRGIALLFHDGGTKGGEWLAARPGRTLAGKEPVSIVQESWWAPGPVWTGGKSHPTRIRSPDRPDRSQSLYRLSYPAHKDTNPMAVFFPLIQFFTAVLSKPNKSDPLIPS